MELAEYLVLLWSIRLTKGFVNPPPKARVGQIIFVQSLPGTMPFPTSTRLLAGFPLAKGQKGRFLADWSLGAVKAILLNFTKNIAWTPLPSKTLPAP